MIIESGEYYSTFYPNNYQGYWAAFLVEAYLAILAMLCFTKRPWLNTTIKLIMIPLFLVVVGGASLKVVTPLIDKLNKSENRNRFIEVMLSESKRSVKNLDLLKGQKTNTVLELKHRREMSKELVSELKKGTSQSWWL